jgi:hypothetical protein
MPARLRDSLINGMRTRPHWWISDAIGENALSRALLGSPKRFKFTRAIRLAIAEFTAQALRKLSVDDNPNIIAERFIDRGFVEGYYKQRESWQLARRAKH